MRGEKKIRAALHSLTTRELWLIACDVHRASDVVAIGGGTMSEWQRYVELENDIMKQIKQKSSNLVCPFPFACTNGWTDEERDELGSLYRRIMKRQGKRPRQKEGGAE